MTNMARVVIPGRPHHVTQRGNHRQKVFFSDKDRETYMKLMRKYFRKHKVDLIGYALMPNHVHLAVIPALENSLAKGVGLLHNDFSRWQQIQRDQTGHLWQNRFFSNPMDDIHCWMALRYIELNPVRAGLVQNPWDWPWSSARAHTTGADDTGMLDMGLWSKHFDKISWKEFLLEGSDKAAETDHIRQANRTGRPLGSDDFVMSLEKLTGRTLFPKKRGPKPRLGKKLSQ
jgi:putative transposase